MFNRSLLKAALYVCALCPVVSFGLASAQQAVNAQLSPTSASVSASVKQSDKTQNLIASTPNKQLIATVRSQGEPQRGQKGRSSGNFSTDNMPRGYNYLCWEVSETSAKNPSGIKFNVKEDIRVFSDKTKFTSVTPGTKSEVVKARNLYISSPDGAYDKFGNTVGFAVNVYACN